MRTGFFRRLTVCLGLLRHAFRRWLAHARSVEKRRQAHEQKEEQMRQLIITNAWEKWRERFKEERLRPLVCHRASSMDCKLTSHITGIRTYRSKSAWYYDPCPAIVAEENFGRPDAFMSWFRRVKPLLVASCGAFRYKAFEGKIPSNVETRATTRPTVYKSTANG